MVQAVSMSWALSPCTGYLQLWLRSQVAHHVSAFGLVLQVFSEEVSCRDM